MTILWAALVVLGAHVAPLPSTAQPSLTTAQPALTRAPSTAPAACLHPDSRSSSRVVVQGARAELELVAQARTVLESLPMDGAAGGEPDGLLDTGELEQGRANLERYVLERYQLFPARDAGRDDNFASAVPLAGRLVEARLLEAAESAQGEPRVRLYFEFEAPARLEELTLRVRVFREQNPFHRDEARLEFQDDLPARHLFAGSEGEVWRYVTERERRPEVFLDYWQEGLRHIAGGYDHLAFLLALVLASRRWRSVVLVVTAFTLAHTLTLALASFDVLSVRSDLVEMAIALSIAYVGALNLLPRPPPSRWLEAFLFGLVHGLGFAGAIRDALSFEPLRLSALFGFNLGVECGQLAIVLPLALLFSLSARWGRGERREQGFLAPPWLVRGGSVIIVCLGLYWFLERIGLLS